MTEKLQKLQTKRKLFRVLYLFMALYLISALVLLYRVRIFGLFISFLAPVLYLVFVLPALKRFSREKQLFNLEYAYGTILDGLEQEVKGTFKREEVEQAGIIPTQEKGFLVLNGIRGTYRNLTVTASELSNYHRLDLTDPHCSHILFLTGVMIRIKLSKSTGYHLRAVSVGLLARETRAVFFQSMQSLHEVSPPDGSLKDKFCLYTADGLLPDHRLCEEILKLRSSARDNIAIAIEDDTVFIFLQNRFLTANYKVYDEISPQNLQRVPCPELEAALQFAWRI